MPVVKVRTAKCCTVPKSASVSISASATPADDRRPRQRQGQPRKQCRQGMAEGAAGLQQADALLLEGVAAEQVDVGVEHHRQHQRGAGQAADLGEPVLAPAQPGDARAAWSAPGRRRPAARYRHSRRHRPASPSAAAAPPPARGWPGKRQAVTSQAESAPAVAVISPTSSDQQRGIRQHLRQGGAGDVVPDRARRHRGRDQHRQQRRGDQPGQRQGQQAPARHRLAARRGGAVGGGRGQGRRGIEVICEWFSDAALAWPSRAGKRAGLFGRLLLRLPFRDRQPRHLDPVVGRGCTSRGHACGRPGRASAYRRSTSRRPACSRR